MVQRLVQGLRFHDKLQAHCTTIPQTSEEDNKENRYEEKVSVCLCAGCDVGRDRLSVFVVAGAGIQPEFLYHECRFGRRSQPGRAYRGGCNCQKLATAAGSTGKTWRAYLSTSAGGNQPAVNARDRIGRGPWQNVKGVVVAQNVDDLHSDNNKLSKENPSPKKERPSMEGAILPTPTTF